MFNFFSIFFLRNFWKNSGKFLKIFRKKSEKNWKIVNPEIFCCQPFKTEWKQTVLLLFSKFSASVSLLLAVPRYQKWRKTSCFAAIFKLLRCFSRILTNFRFFQIFFRFFSDVFQIFFRNFWFFLKNFRKNCESRNFLLPAIQKWRKLAVLLLFSKFSASFSLLLAVLLLFSIFLCCFSRVLTNFRFFSEILVRNISKINQIYPVPQHAGQKVSSLSQINCF